MELDSFLDAARDLLAVPSTADRPEQLNRALEFVLDFVGDGVGDGQQIERFESRGKPSALVYRRPPGGGQRPEFRVIFNAHLDVVPAEPEQFVPRVDADRLYARGAHDMKVSGLVMAQVFRELAPVLPYPIALQLVTDEEVGGRDGTLHQLEQGVTGRFVVIGENSALSIVADSKGLLHAQLLATGRSGHSAYPWNGDSALLKLLATIDRLLARYPVATEEVWRTTVSIARIDTTNRAFNQIPADAQAWIDLRYPPEDTDLRGRSEAELVEFLESFCGPGVSVRIDHTDPPHHADHDTPAVKLLQQAARAQGYPGSFLRKHGAADARFYAQRGIDAVAFGIGGAGQHGPEEFADITTILPYHHALTDFLEQQA